MTRRADKIARMKHILTALEQKGAIEYLVMRGDTTVSFPTLSALNQDGPIMAQYPALKTLADDQTTPEASQNSKANEGG